MGHAALSTNTTGADLAAFGGQALYGNTTGANNTAAGSQALYATTTGASNTAVGYQSGNALTTGGQNVFVGGLCNASIVGATNQIVLGYNGAGSGNGTITVADGTTDSTMTLGGTTWSAPSDVRMKEEVETSTAGLSFINDLRPVTFKWKKEKDIPEELVSHKADSEERYNNDTVNHGFIAQEVKEVIDNHPEIKEGFDLWREDDVDGRQRVGASALEIVLTKAVQELSAKVEELETKLNNKEK